MGSDIGGYSAGHGRDLRHCGRTATRLILGGMDVEVLSREESLALLASVPVGRIVFTVRALPAIQPMNFVVDNGGIVIRTGPGTKLSATLQNGVVAFETDEIDPARSEGWSVTVVGRIQEITDPFEIERLDAALTPWAPGERQHFLKITPEVVTGRRLTARTVAAEASRGGAAGIPQRRLTERDTPLENGPPLRSWPYDQSSV
jgi:uncharacterized protein